MLLTPEEEALIRVSRWQREAADKLGISLRPGRVFIVEGEYDAMRLEAALDRHHETIETTYRDVTPKG